MLKSLLSISLVAATTVTLINFPIAKATANSRETCSQNSESDGQFYRDTGVTALTREGAISRLRRAEFHFACSKNEEKLAEVRTILGNVNQIDFAKNRRVRLEQLRAFMAAVKEAGHEHAIPDIQARIKAIESLRD
ncbi:hypothetical protein ACQ4M3_10740 [Leptolyngbya sp. AN03gr2]|uniref:hypothetical protein n=1 Tax=unclassified Leptolyngbya TaxID=2650499 RepID=UPI003D31EF79